MLKKYIVLFLLLFNVYLPFTFSQNQYVDYFMKMFDGLELEEMIAKIGMIKEELEEIGLMKENLLLLHTFEKEEEEFSDELPESFDVIKAEKEYEEFLAGLRLHQFYNPDYTRIQIDDWGDKKYLPDIPAFTVHKIWYHDGSVDSVSHKQFYTDMKTPQKVIDSALVTVSYNYVKGYETYKVKDQTEIPGGSIKVQQIKENKAVVLIQGREYDLHRIIGLNSDGQSLKERSRYFLYDLPSDYYQLIPDYVKALEKVGKKAGKVKSVEKLREICRKALVSLPALENEKNGMFMYTGYYEGNVESVLVYFLTDENKVIEEREITLKNSTEVPPVFVKWDGETDKYGLANPSGEYVSELVDTVFFQINHFYYAIGDEYDYIYPHSRFSLYYFDMEKKEFIELPEIDEYILLNDSCIAIKKNGHYALWNQDGEPKTDYIYDHVSPLYHSKLFRVTTGELTGLINAKGDIVYPVVMEEISSLYEGVAVVKDREKGYMLIDSKGNIAVSLQEYSYVGRITEGLLPVKKESKYGFIDAIRGEVVIPLIYDKVSEYFSSEGITLVMCDELWGLVDTTGKVVVPVSSPVLEVGMIGDEWEYRLNGIAYDAYGQPVE